MITFREALELRDSGVKFKIVELAVIAVNELGGCTRSECVKFIKCSGAWELENPITEALYRHSSFGEREGGSSRYVRNGVSNVRRYFYRKPKLGFEFTLNPGGQGLLDVLNTIHDARLVNAACGIQAAPPAHAVPAAEQKLTKMTHDELLDLRDRMLDKLNKVNALIAAEDELREAQENHAQLLRDFEKVSV